MWKPECSKCKNFFDKASDLQLHEEMPSLSFLCDLCSFEAASDDDLNKHKIDEHSDDQPVPATAQQVENNGKNMNCDEENIELKRKLRMIEDSYDRLIHMFQKQQLESKDKALAYKSELEGVNECLRVVKTETEKLKEINETQHKLWKIFLNKIEKQDAEKVDDKKKSKPDGNKEKPSPTNSDDDIEIVDDDDELDTESSYQEWLKDSRSRGFKRSNPTSSG